VIHTAEMKHNRRLTPMREVVSSNPESDARAILERLLPKMFRRSVSDEELKPYFDSVISQLDAGTTFHNAVRFGLKAALCSRSKTSTSSAAGGKTIAASAKANA
jgi:TorA maturation chaperone TorD